MNTLDKCNRGLFQKCYKASDSSLRIEENKQSPQKPMRERRREKYLYFVLLYSQNKYSTAIDMMSF